MTAIFQHDIDARGLRCPEPVMMLHARLRRMAAGETARVIADDPATARDIPKLCDNLGHGFLGAEAGAGEYAGATFYYVRKRG